MTKQAKRPQLRFKRSRKGPYCRNASNDHSRNELHDSRKIFQDILSRNTYGSIFKINPNAIPTIQHTVNGVLILHTVKTKAAAK